MKKTLLTIALSTAIFNSAHAAPGDSLPYTFSNGTPANADQVNANFSEVLNQITTLSTTGGTGTAGNDGVGISTITDNGNGTLTITLTDSTSTTHTMPAGPQGIQGITGPQGAAGPQGTTGAQGPAGPQGATGTDGLNGADGTNGTNGVDGTSITSITDDGAGTLTINLSDSSSSTHSIPVATQTYSYRDYSHNYTTKSFTVIDTLNAYDTEVRTYTRTGTVGVDSLVSYTRDRSSGGTRTQYATITLDNNGPELLFTKFENHNPTTLAVSETRTMTPGVTQRTESMELGRTFGTLSALESSTQGTSGVIQTSTLIAGTHDTMVNGVTYTGCINISSHRSAPRLGNTFDAVHTFCPGVGLVRIVQNKQYLDATPSLQTQSIATELSTCDGSVCTQP